jgi:hypothetical protein
MQKMSGSLAAIAGMAAVCVVLGLRMGGMSVDLLQCQRSHAEETEKIKNFQFAQDIIGTKFDGQALRRLFGDSRRERALTLFCFFSMHGCSSCLMEESAQWERASKEAQVVNIEPVCIDSIVQDAYRFKLAIPSSLPCSWLDPRKMAMPRRGTPYALLVDENATVIWAYLAEIQNASKRESFYAKLRALGTPENHVSLSTNRAMKVR